MKPIAFAVWFAAVAFGCCGCNEPAAPPSPADAAVLSPTVDDLTAVLGSDGTTVEQRIDAEARLSALPEEEVLMALMPEMTKELTLGDVYNSHGCIRGDQALPIQWRARESYYRVWDEVSHHDRQLAARCLTQFLRSAITPRQRSFAAYQLRFFWTDEAEQDVVDLLHDVDSRTFHPALVCLLTHRREKYYEQARRLTAQLPTNNGDEVLFKSHAIRELLAESVRQVFLSGGFITYDIDDELVVMGFDLVQTMKSRGKGIDTFLIHDLCAYLGRPFQPEEYDLVDRASAWWCENRDRYHER